MADGGCNTRKTVAEYGTSIFFSSKGKYSTNACHLMSCNFINQPRYDDPLCSEDGVRVCATRRMDVLL